MQLATTLSGFLQYQIPIPMGVLLVLFVLIILPTGDLLRLATVVIDGLTYSYGRHRQSGTEPPDEPERDRKT